MIVKERKEFNLDLKKWRELILFQESMAKRSEKL